MAKVPDQATTTSASSAGQNPLEIREVRDIVAAFQGPKGRFYDLVCAPFDWGV